MPEKDESREELPAILRALRHIYAGERIFVVGKGPSLQNFVPFLDFSGSVNIGINNVYRYFPHCRYVVLWHREVYEADAAFLADQSQFTLFYGTMGGLPADLPNAHALDYGGDFPLRGTGFGTLSTWKQSPRGWMFKTTFATAVRLAWWMGASRITLLGCDFSLNHGYTACNEILVIPTTLRNFTQEQIFQLQAQVYENLVEQLSEDGVRLERIFGPGEL